MLELINVTKIFDTNTINQKVALDDISVTINDNDFITIIGSNGTGKSTLFNCIAGNMIPEKGNILLDGKDITFDPDYKRASYIGRLFQDPSKGTAPNMTIEENLGLAYLSANKNKNSFSVLNNEDREYLKSKLKELNLNLENQMNQKVGTLSGGQRQALSLLMATIVSPRILLLDEHTAALDPATAQNIMNITNDIVSKNNICAMMITHNLQHALDTGNRLFMMDKGKIILDLNKQEKEKLTVNDLLNMFKEKTGYLLDNDRILLN